VPDHLSRRAFLGATGATVAGASLARPASATPAVAAPAVILRPPARPAAISSANSLAPVTKAVELMLEGADTLDAGVAGVKIQELDPTDNSVGYGGLPNEDGVVQLDASCMHGPTRRAGAVGCLEGISTPSLPLVSTSRVAACGTSSITGRNAPSSASSRTELRARRCRSKALGDSTTSRGAEGRALHSFWYSMQNSTQPIGARVALPTAR